MTSSRLRRQVASALWDEPLCTRFFPLMPCGLGTGLQESLPSYLDRLADAHRVPIFCFMRRFVYQEAHYDKFQLYHLAPTFLVGNEAGIRKAALVAGNTSVPEVNQLVQPMFIRNRSAQLNFRAKQAWCHLCLRDWAEEGNPIYRPFLWSVAWCKSCPIHRVYLQDRCPECSMQFQLLGPRNWKLNCPGCSKPLSCPPRKADNASRSSAFDHDCALILAEHLRWCIEYGTANEPESRFHENLETALEVVRHADFLRATALNPGAVQQWRETLRLPELGHLLRLSYCFDLSMHRWLFEQLLPLAFEAVTPKAVGESFARPRTAEVPLEEAQTALRAAATDSACPSIKRVSEDTGISVPRMRKNFPGLFRRIRERHSRAKSRRLELSIREETRLVRQAMAELQEERGYVSANGVIRLLKRNGVKISRLCRELASREVQACESI